MRRGLFNFATASLLFLAMVIAAIWVRSLFVCDQIVTSGVARDGAGESQWMRAYISSRGFLLVRRDDQRYQVYDVSQPIAPSRVTSGDTSSEYRRTEPSLIRGDRLLGFGWQRQVIQVPSDNAAITLTIRLMIVPLWVLIVPLLPLPLLWIARHRRRSRAGYCPHCGYDLRATPDRCPECGRITAEVR